MLYALIGLAMVGLIIIDGLLLWPWIADDD